MANNALYNIYAARCFSLAHTMVIHNQLVAKSLNERVEKQGFRVNHNNLKTHKYYMNLAGEYHDVDKIMIGDLNGDGHPYMRIKIAGNGKPIWVDFTKDLLSGLGADLSLAAEYVYGSTYYNELLRRYPGCESLIQGILNPIDLDIATESENGDVLYCGGYYRKRLPGLKELWGFEKRQDVMIDAEFLIEDWEEDLIFQLQDFIKRYNKRWVIQDFQANHSYFAATMMAGLMGGLITNIHRFRTENIRTYAAHSYHVKEYINSYGYLGKYVDGLTREQAMYLYFNMDWLSSNKGKEKVLTALIDNLLTPSGIPLTAYNMGHDNWDMQTGDSITPTIEFKKEYLNLDPKIIDTGTDTKTMLIKEIPLARDNGLFIDDRTRAVEEDAKYTEFDKLKTKILESDFTEVDGNVFFNLEEYQFSAWLYALSKGVYKGSIFITHPTSGGRLQLTPLTAMILMVYCYTKGYYGYELETFPTMTVRNIPKHPRIIEDNSDNYPDDEALFKHSTSPLTTVEKVEAIKNFPLPVFSYNSSTDFFNKTKEDFDILEARRALAAGESDIFANAELELIVSKFYHKTLEIPPLMTGSYNTWLNNMGIDLSGMDRHNLQRFADELIIVGIGASESKNKSAERMHEAIINILKFFLSYTVQLVTRFSKTTSRTYGLKTLRLSHNYQHTYGRGKWDVGLITMLHGKGYYRCSDLWSLGTMVADTPNSFTVIRRFSPLIPMIMDQAVMVKSSISGDFVGFNMLEHSDGVPKSPLARTFKRDMIVPITKTIPDYNELIGGINLTVELDSLGMVFEDTLGLSRLSSNDINFTFKK